MRKFRFRVIDDAHNAVANWNGDASFESYITDVITALALININERGLSKQRNYEAIVKFLTENANPKTPFLDYMYMEIIYDTIKRVKKWGWYNIEPLEIRKSELDKIKALNDVAHEKIVFSILVLCKYYNAIKNTENDITFEDCDTIFPLSRVSVKAKDRQDFLYFLGDTGLVEFHAYLTNQFYKCTFISRDETDPVIMTIDETDMLELAYCYLNWRDGGGYKRCAQCGRWFRLSTSPGRVGKDEHVRRSNAKLCWNCAEANDHRDPFTHVDVGFGVELQKTVKCVDCGIEVVLDNPLHDTETCRCDECQTARRKELDAERARKYRLRKKNMQ